MFGKWLTRGNLASRDANSANLMQIVQEALPKADEETWIVVTAIAALLGAVAYADRDYSPAEEQRVRGELGKIEGMTAFGVEAVCKVLRTRIRELATVEVPQHCHELRELADRDLRVEVLRVLLEVAAADGTISFEETTLLREITKFLGLSQDDYTILQEKHRQRLAILKPATKG